MPIWSRKPHKSNSKEHRLGKELDPFARAMKLMASIELFLFLINVYTSTNLNSEDLDWNGLNSNIANQNDHNFES